MGDTTLSIGAVSYGIATVAFVLLTGLLVSGWRGKFQGALLAAAAGVSALWAGLSAYASVTSGALSAVADLLEIARDGLWLLFLWKLLVSRALPEDVPTHQRMKRWFGLGALLFGAIFLATLTLHTHLLAFSAQAQFITIIIGRVVLAVIGLALVEQLYRNAPEAQRWAIKYFCLGLGALFAYDFYLYPMPALFRTSRMPVYGVRAASSMRCWYR